MSLDLSKLENIKENRSHIIARCPACAEQGRDRKGNHLSIDEKGRFTCVLYSGESGRVHRKRIFKLVGGKGQMNTSIKVKAPQYKLNQNSTTSFTDSDNRNLGRLGRVNLTHKESMVIEKDILGRLGRLFITPHIDSQKRRTILCKEYEIAVPSVPTESGGACHATSTQMFIQHCESVPVKKAPPMANADEPTAVEAEAIYERMCIMGENCEPEEAKPYVSDYGILVIPWNSARKYHYWNEGQSVCDTLKELGRCDLIEKYKSIYCN